MAPVLVVLGLILLIVVFGDALWSIATLSVGTVLQWVFYVALPVLLPLAIAGVVLWAFFAAIATASRSQPPAPRKSGDI